MRENYGNAFGCLLKNKTKPDVSLSQMKHFPDCILINNLD